MSYQELLLLSPHSCKYIQPFNIVTFSDYFDAYYMQINTGTASLLYLNPFTKVLSFILYNYILNLSYHCMIQSTMRMTLLGRFISTFA